MSDRILLANRPVVAKPPAVPRDNVNADPRILHPAQPQPRLYLDLPIRPCTTIGVNEDGLDNIVDIGDICTNAKMNNHRRIDIIDLSNPAAVIRQDPHHRPIRLVWMIREWKLKRRYCMAIEKGSIYRLIRKKSMIVIDRISIIDHHRRDEGGRAEAREGGAVKVVVQDHRHHRLAVAIDFDTRIHRRLRMIARDRRLVARLLWTKEVERQEGK